MKGERDKDWQAVAEEAILDYFRTHGAEPFHSDDLEHVIPDEYRGVISLAVMALVNKKLIIGCGYRKSAIPSRKRSPSQEYRLTELGRNRIAGVRSDNREGTAVHEDGTLDRPGADSVRASHSGARSSLTADPGESSPAARSGTAGEARPTTETLSLLPKPPRLFDHDQPRAA